MTQYVRVRKFVCVMVSFFFFESPLYASASLFVLSVSAFLYLRMMVIFYNALIA